MLKRKGKRTGRPIRPPGRLNAVDGSPSRPIPSDGPGEPATTAGTPLPSRATRRHGVDRRRTGRPLTRRRSRQLQPAGGALGTADLRPRVPGHRPGRRRPRRRPGNLPPRLPCARRLQGPGKILLLALPHHAESVPRLDSARAPRRRSPRRPRASTSSSSPRRPSRPNRSKISSPGASSAERSPRRWRCCPTNNEPPSS